MSGCKTSIKKLKDVSEATALVLDWFEQQNKPSTPQSLTDALGSRVAKTLIQKILDKLYADGKLCVKDLKKTRFYYLRMTERTEGNEGDGKASPAFLVNAAAQATESQLRGDEMHVSAEVDNSAVLHDIGLAASALVEKHRRLKRWRGWPSRADWSVQRDALETEVRQLELDVETLQEGLEADKGKTQNTETSAFRAQRAVRRYRRARQLWTERKGWAMCLLEATGGDVHSPQHMARLLGCTTDADVGISFESTAVALPQQMLRGIGLT